MTIQFSSVTLLLLLLLLSHFSRVRLCVTPWTAACQASLSMGFPRQKYWSWLPFPSPGDLPDPGIEAESSLVLLEEGVCYDQCVLLAKVY